MNDQPLPADLFEYQHKVAADRIGLTMAVPESQYYVSGSYRSAPGSPQNAQDRHNERSSVQLKLASVRSTGHGIARRKWRLGGAGIKSC